MVGTAHTRLCPPYGSRRLLASALDGKWLLYRKIRKAASDQEVVQLTRNRR
jgi:hypothetical protein